MIDIETVKKLNAERTQGSYYEINANSIWTTEGSGGDIIENVMMVNERGTTDWANDADIELINAAPAIAELAIQLDEKLRVLSNNESETGVFVHYDQYRVQQSTIKQQAEEIQAIQTENLKFARERLALAQEIQTYRKALNKLQSMAENGMQPDPGEWLTFHDKVSQICFKALNNNSEEK